MDECHRTWHRSDGQWRNKDGLNSMALYVLFGLLYIDLIPDIGLADATLSVGPWITRYYLWGLSNAVRAAKTTNSTNDNAAFKTHRWNWKGPPSESFNGISYYVSRGFPKSHPNVVLLFYFISQPWINGITNAAQQWNQFLKASTWRFRFYGQVWLPLPLR